MRPRSLAAGRRRGRARPWAAAGTALLLLAVLAASAWGQAPDAVLGGDFTDRPVRRPEAVSAGVQNPSFGFQFGVGHAAHTVTIEGLDSPLEPEGGFFTEGAVITAGFLLESFRLGYALQIYRHELPDGTVLRDKAVDFASFESHQIWAFHGIRPWRPLYLGYGLGVQTRNVRLYGDGALRVQDSEGQTSAALLLDYRFTQPYSLQLRWTEDLGGGFITSGGLSLQLAFYVPF